MEGNSSDSDNEAPEVMSSANMKSEREQEIQQIFKQKRKLAEEAKLKRKLKQEKLAAQKKEKLQRLQDQLQDAAEPEVAGGDAADAAQDPDTGITGTHITTFEEPLASEKLNIDPTRKKRSKGKKAYPKYNVEVDSLKQLVDPRALSALNFKQQQLAKVHRKNVASTLFSNQEKLNAKNNVRV